MFLISATQEAEAAGSQTNSWLGIARPCPKRKNKGSGVGRQLSGKALVQYAQSPRFHPQDY